MRVRTTLPMFAALLFAVTGTAGRSGDAPSAAQFATLVTAAERGDTGVDYTLLRMSYPFTQQYDPYGLKETEFDEAFTAYTRKDCKTAVEKAAAALKTNYVEFGMHFVRQRCFEQMGDRKDAALEFAIGKGLADSLIGEGDGKTLETAFRVVTLHEEDFILSGLHLTKKSQALIEHDGEQYDLIEAADQESGRTSNVYFDVSALFAAMARQHE